MSARQRFRGASETQIGVSATLEVAGAGLDDGARIETIGREPREHGFAPIVKDGITMFARRADVDVRTASIAVFEKWKPLQHILGRNTVETGKHPSIAQHADIIELRFYSVEHVANVISVLSIQSG